MPNQDDIDAQQALLQMHRQTLDVLLKQQAQFGEPYAPPAIVNGINIARASIAQIKQSLRSWGAPAEDLPNDGRARVARDLRVVAAQIECGQSCGARLPNLCIGDLKLRLPDAHLIAFTKNAREGIGHRNPDRI